MIAYRKEKLDNAICFFALEHKKAARKPVTQTYLYKYLAFLDFLSVEKSGKPAFDLKYRAMKRGPVPIGIYNRRHDLKTDLYEFRDEGENVFAVYPRGKPNLDYFSEFEMNLMQGLISKYASRYSRADEISEDSHQEIKAWKKAYIEKENSIIDFALTFEEDIARKKEKDLSQAEASFLTYSSIKNAT